MQPTTKMFKNTVCAENFILFLQKDQILKAIQQQQPSVVAETKGTTEFIPFTSEPVYTTVENNSCSSNQKWRKPTVKYEYTYAINEDTTRTSKVYEILPSIYDERQWPDRTNIYCWHCVHPFDSKPVPVPLSYDQRKQTFKVFGCFCSFNCAKAYILGRMSGPSVHTCCSLLTFLHRKVMQIKTHRPIKKAPPVTALNVFGGPLTIQEFRNACGDEIQTVNQLQFPLVVVVNDHIEISNVDNTYQDKELHHRMNQVTKSWGNKRKTFENNYGLKVTTTFKKRK